MRTLRNKIVAVGVIAVAVLISANSCEEEASSQQSESESRSASYNAQVDAQPAERMSYSPTRETINFWISTWDEPGKLSYVYLQNADGTMIGYYVMEGLPVNMCAALTPNYEKIEADLGDFNGEMLVPAPSVDGVYYSGGQCMTYYGKDATTGTYLEYTAGLGINVLLFEEPLPRYADTQPLGPTEVSDVD
jgi:hypothetical protein